jgi:hypothetical protein
MIPVPVRYGNNASFAQSYLTALWFVQRPRGDGR